MRIEVLGAECSKCKETEKTVRAVVKELGADAEIVKITDVNEMINRGVMTIPAVFVDGELKSLGIVPTKEEIKEWISGK
jgi:small redox-active disulfide protein 2